MHTQEKLMVLGCINPTMLMRVHKLITPKLSSPHPEPLLRRMEAAVLRMGRRIELSQSHLHFVNSGNDKGSEVFSDKAPEGAYTISDNQPMLQASKLTGHAYNCSKTMHSTFAESRFMNDGYVRVVGEEENTKNHDGLMKQLLRTNPKRDAKRRSSSQVEPFFGVISQVSPSSLKFRRKAQNLLLLHVMDCDQSGEGEHKQWRFFLICLTCASKIRELTSPRVTSHRKKVKTFVLDPASPGFGGGGCGVPWADGCQSDGHRMRRRSAGMHSSPGVKTRSMAYHSLAN
ncbi:hypothetical protein B484DRAFT_467548, partial [Ochromonadaceae sp. CCMP2298]